MRHYDRFKIPTAFIGYLEFGDPTGLTDQEVELINAFVESNFSHHGYIVDWVGIDEPYFSPYPDIGGLGAEVVDADFYYA